MIRLSLLILLLASSATAQDWHSSSVWGYPPPRDAYRDRATVIMPFPDNSPQNSQNNTIAFLTTTNTPELLGDLTGKTIIADIVIRAPRSTVFFLHTSTSGLPPNVRLFFTTTTQPYVVSEANQNETAYWWATATNYVCLRPGAFRLEVPLEPEQWSDALGHFASDPSYRQAFFDAVANVRQIGLSFGGGRFFDVGVGVIHPNTTTSLRVVRYVTAPPREYEWLTGRPIERTVKYGNTISTGADATPIRD